MRTKARRVQILLFDEVELYDVAAPAEILSVAGRHWNFRPYKLELIAEQTGFVTTRNQLRLEASYALAQAEPAEILLIPGGFGARRFAENANRLAEVARLSEGAELIGCIGNGAMVIESAGMFPKNETLPALASAPPPRRGLREEGRVLQAFSTGDALELGLAIVRRTLGQKLVTWVCGELGLETRERLEFRY
ncbi:MAG TPA: DJ-1/PfpI family protein [Polyangiaceae bacterium]|nr:DJ-1/PfpI family protein [Polyangiaceae bacterium]